MVLEAHQSSKLDSLMFCNRPSPPCLHASQLPAAPLYIVAQLGLLQPTAAWKPKGVE